MKVSIIIPIYKVEPYIVRCVKSAISQRYTNIEVILVNDCSPDKSMELAKEAIESSDFTGEVLYLSHEQNRGLSAARNTGIAHSTGDYLYFLDSDDAMTPNCIEILINKIGNHDFAIANYKAINTSNEYPSLKLPDGAVIEGREVLYSYMSYRWYMMAFNKLVKKDFLIKEKLFFLEGFIHEDQLWSYMLAATASSFVVTREKTYLYYIRENSITTNENTKRKLIHHCEIYKKMVLFSLEKGIASDKKVVKFLNQFSKLMYVSLLPLLKDRKEQERIYMDLRTTQLLYYKPLVNRPLPGRVELHLMFSPASALSYLFTLKRIKWIIKSRLYKKHRR